MARKKTQFGWQPNLATGHHTIDHQHQELFDLVTQLDAIIDSPTPIEETNQMITFLEHYVQEHFSEEETVMKNANYSGYKSHKEEHDYFTAFVENLRDLFTKNHQTQVIFGLRQLIDKIVLHMRDVDSGIKDIAQ